MVSRASRPTLVIELPPPSTLISLDGDHSIATATCCWVSPRSLRKRTSSPRSSALWMTGPKRRYDVTITINKDSSPLPGPAEFAVAAEKAASLRGEPQEMNLLLSGYVNVVLAWLAGKASFP